MEFVIRRRLVLDSERGGDAGRVAEPPLRKIAAIAVADEIALIACIANRGRPNARAGGLTHEEGAARMSTIVA